MYQQQAPQPRDEREWSSSNNEYAAGYTATPQTDDQLADAIARRLQAQIPSGLPMPAFGRNPTIASAGLRLALAIVSVGALVPLAAITLLSIGGFGGLVALAIGCTTVLGINIVFNIEHK